VRGTGRPQEENVVAVDHRAVRYVAVLLPDRAEVEALQRCDPLLEVGEASEPDESVRVVLVEEDATESDPHLLLALDEVVFEDPHKRVPRPRMQGVLPKLDDLGSREPQTVCVDAVGHHPRSYV
jgi:hypothetical protein